MLYRFMLLCIVLFLLSAAPTHHVTLAWDVPLNTSQVNDSWALYRAVGTGTYLLITLLDPSLFFYTDTAVHRHETYTYVITTISGMQESSFSNAVSISIP
jgi:hypothetical protein